MSRRFGLRTVVLLHPPGCRPSMETAGRGFVGSIAGRACGPIPGVASRAALPGYRPDHTAATIDEPMAATQATRSAGPARSSPRASTGNRPYGKRRPVRARRPRSSAGPVQGGEPAQHPRQRSDMGVDLVRQRVRGRRVVEEMSDLQEEATIGPLHPPRSGRWTARECAHSSSEGGHRFVELRARGRTEPKGEYAPHLLLRIRRRLPTGRPRTRAACAGGAACLHYVGHQASPLMAAFDRVLCRDNCVACSSRYRWRQA